MGKATRGGYTITVEGGEDGPKTVHYPAGARREPRPAAPATTPLPNGDSRGRPGAPAALEQGAYPPRPTRQGSVEKRIDEEGEVESPLTRVTKKEEEQSRKRFGKETSEYFGKDERYDRRDPVSYGKWEGAGDSFEKKRSDGVDFSDIFESERVEKKRVSYDTRERQIYAGSGEKAEVEGWTERFSRDKNDKFSDSGRSSALRDRMSEGFKALTQVSMQDINRYQFRRSHSTEKGELPVGRIGADAPTPMKKSAGE